MESLLVFDTMAGTVVFEMAIGWNSGPRLKMVIVPSLLEMVIRIIIT